MIKREVYLKRIRHFYNSELVKVITGIRRSGKSTVVLQIIEELSLLGIDDNQIIYINFEDYEFNSIANPDALYSYIKERLHNKKKSYIFIDEIQNVENFELVINSFQATKNVSIFITGSNSKLLSGELATHLTGRTIEFKILPFNFKEYHQYQRMLGSTKESSKILQEYLEWGGFPLVAKEESSTLKHLILSSLYDSIVLKDIVMRNNVASINILQRILDYIIANSSTTISGNKIAKSLNDPVQTVSSPTVYDYLKFIEEACICDIVPRYDIRGKAILSFYEKIYVCDLGFFKLKKNRVKDELNYIVETLIYNELISRGYKVYIGKTQKGEIDFIGEKDGLKEYYQVAYMLDKESTIEREYNAFREIEDNHPKYLLSMDQINVSRDGIIHINILDWLLSSED